MGAAASNIEADIQHFEYSYRLQREHDDRAEANNRTRTSKSKQHGGILSSVYSQFFHRDAKFSKLMTREDPFHLHKTLGICSVLNFLYRYAFVYPRTGSLGFDGTPFDWAIMIAHTALAFSSIQFRVPRHRIAHKPMIIYEEYRQHAMVFTFRCFSVFAIATLWPESAGRPLYVVPAAVMARHLLVDRITKKWGNGQTAVRANSEKLEKAAGKARRRSYKKVAYFYSLYQFLAIGSHLLPNARLADLGFNTIVAIQSSAFLMTLYRKRIIRGRTHMLVYSLCLLVSAFHMVRLMGAESSALVVAAFALRVNLPRKYSNKYGIWILFLTVFHLRQHLALDDLALHKVLPPTTAAGLSSAIGRLSGMDGLRGFAAAAVLYAGAGRAMPSETAAQQQEKKKQRMKEKRSALRREEPALHSVASKVLSAQ